jgi:hypothetical protein
MSYLAIVSIGEDGSPIKYQEFDEKQEAQNHVDQFGGFVYQNSNASPDHIVFNKSGDAQARTPELSPDEIKAEAERRILLVCPEWKQRNLTARAAELALKGAANLTPEEAEEVAAGQAIWDTIKAIRLASNTIEAMNPIPENFRDDTYWT